MYLVEAFLSSVEVIWTGISRQLVGLAIQGELAIADTIGNTTNRTSNVRTIGEIVCRKQDHNMYYKCMVAKSKPLMSSYPKTISVLQRKMFDDVKTLQSHNSWLVIYPVGRCNPVMVAPREMQVNFTPLLLVIVELPTSGSSRASGSILPTRTQSHTDDDVDVHSFSLVPSLRFLDIEAGRRIYILCPYIANVHTNYNNQQ